MSELTVPKEWAECNISDVISANGVFCDGDWVESKDQDPNGEVRLIQLADIGDGYFKNKSERFLTKEKAKALNCTFLNKGDLLIARLPDPLGRACLFPLRELNRYVTVVDICVVRPNTEKSNSHFLLHLVNSPQIRAEIEKYKSGTTRKRISMKNLAKILLPIAPPPEQTQVVSILEQLFSDLDNAIDNLQKAKGQLKIYRQSVLKYAFEGKLCSFESKVVNTNIEEEFSITMGQSPKSEFYNNHGEGLPFFQGKREFTDLYADADTWTTSYTKSVNKNDVLLSIRAPIGPVNLAPDKCALGRGLAGFKTKDLVESKFIFYLLQTLKHEMDKRGTGTTFKAITKSNLFGIKTNLPISDIDRNKIVAEIESRFSVSDKMEETIENSLNQAEALRQSILKQAFEGKLTEEWRRNNPELISGENSAKALLEKIKAEREVLENTRKRKR